MGITGLKTDIFMRGRTTDENVGMKASNKESVWSCVGANFKDTTAAQRATVAWGTGTITSTSNDLEPIFMIYGIPNGATLTKAIMYGSFTGNWYLKRVNLSAGTGENIVTGALAGTEQTITDKGLVDNIKYAYMFATDLVNLNTTVRGCRLVYTVN